MVEQVIVIYALFIINFSNTTIETSFSHDGQPLVEVVRQIKEY